MATLNYNRLRGVRVVLLGIAATLTLLCSGCSKKGLSKAKKIDFSAIKSPIILKGDYEEQGFG